MRLQVRIMQYPAHASIADAKPRRTKMLPKQMRRPVRHRYAHLPRWTARFGYDFGRVRFGERARGRPDRGASASFSTGASASRKRSRHSNTVRT